MKRNPLSRTTEPPSPDNTPRPKRLRRAMIFCVTWLLVWPAVVYAASYISGFRFPEGASAFIACITLLFIGSYVWVFAWYGLYDTLFRMAAARWPAAKTIRGLLDLIFQLLRTFGRHH